MRVCSMLNLTWVLKEANQNAFLYIFLIIASRRLVRYYIQIRASCLKKSSSMHILRDHNRQNTTKLKTCPPVNLHFCLTLIRDDRTVVYSSFYPRVYVVYRRVYILLCCCCCSCSWEAFNQTCQYIGRQLIKHDQKLDQTRSDMIRHDQTRSSSDRHVLLFYYLPWKQRDDARLNQFHNFCRILLNLA
jgi:hypothetical protein